MKENFSVLVNQKIKTFKKIINVESDKSISHRSLLIASQCIGISKIDNILESEDVKNTIVCLKKLGVKIIKKNKNYLVFGNGFNSFKKPKNNLLYAGNSGTLARMLFAVLATQPNLKIKIVGDNSLNKRDMKRIINPLSKIGCNFYPKNKTTLPLTVEGTNMPLAQKHFENIGSAQVKSAILLAALNTPGVTKIEVKKISRDHTENLLSKIKANIKVKKIGNIQTISLEGQKNLFGFNLDVPGDPSSAAPFVVLTLITPNSKLVIKNINCNPTRIGFIKILKKMNADVKIKNVKRSASSGELIGSIIVNSSKLKAVNISKDTAKFIDEIPILAVVASLSKGTMIINGVSELKHKESDRVHAIICNLNKMRVDARASNDRIIVKGNNRLHNTSIKTFSDHPDLLLNKGVPKEVIEESKKKMRSINSAWNKIQKLKN